MLNNYFNNINGKDLIKWLHWAAAILGIAFAGLLSVFSLDVFSEMLAGKQKFLVLILHLLPVIVLLVLVWLAWKQPFLGAVCFALLAFLYFWMAYNSMHWSAYLLIMGPLLLLSILHFIIWRHQQIHSS